MSSQHSYLHRSFWMTACAFLTLALLTAAEPCRADNADKTYPIKLTNPSHVGDKFDYSASGWRKMHNEITVAGQAPVDQKQDLAVQAQGTIEVLAVDAKGVESKLAFTVKKFVRTDQNPPADILPAGAVVTAEAGNKPGEEKTHFTLAGGELTADQSTALEIILNAHAPNRPTEDETFGTDKPQKVGAVWPIDKAKLAEGSKESGIVIKPDDVTGQSTLVAVMPIDGKEYARVAVEFSVKDVQIPLPGGAKIESCKMDAKYSTLYPTEGARAKRTDSMEMNMDMRAKAANPDGGAVNVHAIIQMHADLERTPSAP